MNIWEYIGKAGGSEWVEVCGDFKNKIYNKYGHMNERFMCKMSVVLKLSLYCNLHDFYYYIILYIVKAGWKLMIKKNPVSCTQFC